MSKYGTGLAFLVLLSIQSNCFSLNLNRDAGLKTQADAANDFDHIRMRTIRKTFGYPSPVQSRDQTVIVMPNSASNRGLPSSNNSNGPPTVIINMPDNNNYPTGVGRRHIVNSKKLSH